MVGTGTLAARKPEQRAVSLPALAPLVRRELERGGRVAVVFGPEKHGLTRDHLASCHLLAEIPTDARQPSMNLGQAVAVCLYELASRAVPAAEIPARADWPQRESEEAAAPSGALDRLAELIDETMAAAGYSPRAMQAANRHDLRLLLRRMRLNPADARRILGIFRRILWRLRCGERGA